MIDESSSRTRARACNAGTAGVFLRASAIASLLLPLLLHAPSATGRPADASRLFDAPQDDPSAKTRSAAQTDSSKKASKSSDATGRKPAVQGERKNAKKETAGKSDRSGKGTDRKTDFNTVIPPPIFTPFPLATNPAGVVYDTTVWKPARGKQERFSRVLSERNLTPVEAVEELLTLLEKHPEFRRTILREIFAGEGMKTIKPLEVEEYLMRAVKAMRFKSSYEYELAKRGGGGYTGPYDPVYGFDRDKTVGFQVNVFELLKFLQGLIGGGK